LLYIMCSNKNYYFVYLFQRLCILCFEWSMLVLGPCLIVTVIMLVSCETYWALAVLVPRATPLWSTRWWTHATWIVFLAFNGLFNYFSCVFTNPGTHMSHVFSVLVFEASESGTLAVLCLAAYYFSFFILPLTRFPLILRQRQEN